LKNSSRLDPVKPTHAQIRNQPTQRG
jgi:hypothetical protein